MDGKGMSIVFSPLMKAKQITSPLPVCCGILSTSVWVNFLFSCGFFYLFLPWKFLEGPTVAFLTWLREAHCRTSMISRNSQLKWQAASEDCCQVRPSWLTRKKPLVLGTKRRQFKALKPSQLYTHSPNQLELSGICLVLQKIQGNCFISKASSHT